MLIINEKDPQIEYEERFSSYGIIKNDQGQIAVVEVIDWGYIFVGGKIEKGENPKEAIQRESLEEIGYELTMLNFYEKLEVYYNVFVYGKSIDCHNIADFYIGTIGNKIQEPIEKNTKLHWFYPKELFGKMKLDFQNVILERLFK